MNKVYGTIETYIPYRQDASRHVISYGMEALKDNIHATWYEVYIYKKQKPSITYNELKDAVLNDINARTDERILSGFVWNDINVWLSSENQFNFKAAFDLAAQTQGQSLPVKFKLGENEDKEPVYHTFNDMQDFTDFYTKAIAYINECLNEGWAEKDSIDWSQYAPFFPVVND